MMVFAFENAQSNQKLNPSLFFCETQHQNMILTSSYLHCCNAYLDDSYKREIYMKMKRVYD